MKKNLELVSLTKEEAGILANNNDLWDYPVEELSHIINDTDIKKVGLYNDRLYEMN